MNDCPTCHGSGWWQYDDNHAQPCPLCCKHDQGVWLLTEHYHHAGEWCCKAGCGTTWKGIVDYQRAVAQLT